VLKDLPEIPDMRIRFDCGRFLFEAFDCYISLFYVGFVQQASVFWGSRPICGLLANYEQVWSAHAKKRTIFKYIDFFGNTKLVPSGKQT